MKAERLEILLEKFCDGDSSAIEQVVRVYELHLRAVVRRRISDRLRAKFDSEDVVQSVWVHVLRRLRTAGLRLANAAHLEAMLRTEARHRLTDRLRRYQSALDREQPFLESNAAVAPASSQARPSETVQADQLWEKMLALCPSRHHDLLRLRREGMSLGRIAARTGMHEGSIRRILRRLARQLATQEDYGPGARNDREGISFSLLD
ncbi:MAG TPA: sigma-70 family RNA polymerase sigma factor [Gemmataceae bacterium]|nr:sigma-70 family RNA polymerase sigma factor [Gemmataceae bacterium]